VKPGTAAPLDGPERNSFCGMTVRMTLLASLTMRGTTKSWKPTFTGDLPASVSENSRPPNWFVVVFTSA
jgi:hypothetical protein